MSEFVLHRSHTAARRAPTGRDGGAARPVTEVRYAITGRRPVPYGTVRGGSPDTTGSVL